MRGFLSSLGMCFLLACACLAAQGTPQQAQPQPSEAVKEPGAEAALGAPAPVDPKTFILGPEDVVLVRVWREPEHSGLVTIRPDGKITLPLVGEIQAGGLTPEKLDAAITKELSKYINNPDVIVQVQSVRSSRYYVSGEVNRSGAFPLVTPTTILQALTLAGGFRDFANKKNIAILRGAKRLKFNYNDVIKGKNLEQNILLEHGDYIVVP